MNLVSDGQPYTDPLLMLPSRLRANSEVSGRCIWSSSWGEEGKPERSEGAMWIPGNLSQGTSFSCKCTLSKFKAVSHTCLRWGSWFCRDHGVQNLCPVAISSGSDSEHSLAPTTLLLEHSHYTSSRTLPLERSLQEHDPPQSILVSTQFPFCSCHPINPRSGVRNGIRTPGNGNGMFQHRHGILTVGQSSVFPEVLLHWKLCSLMLWSLSGWKTVREQRIIRPRDRKQTKLTLLNFYQCGGSDHDFCTHSTNVTHRDKKKHEM